MKPVDEELRRKIDSLRKTLANSAEPTWRLDIFRDREKMLGVIQGDRITTGAPDDIQPSVAQRDDGVYFVVFSRGAWIYEMRGVPNNRGVLTWSEPVALFGGEDPDVDFYGEFTTVGIFNTQELMMAYEQPKGQIKFRKRVGGVWETAKNVVAGTNPSVVRAWADPPEVGTQDQGLVIVYTQGGQLKYTHSDDEGLTWAVGITLNMPQGGNKKNAQVFRMADFTLGIIYEYDNGITSEVWFLKTTRKYVNIASPDETLRVGAGSFRQGIFILSEITAPNETFSVSVREYRHGIFTLVYPENLGATGIGSGSGDDGMRETTSVGATGFRQAVFTGVNP